MIETGIVTMYARHFTGKRALPGRWWPKGKRKVTHDWLMAYRHVVVAHADETTLRQLMPLETQGPGPPVFALAETRRHMSADDLKELIHHCERMWWRYSDEVLRLKWKLGIAASGEIVGPEEYDE